MREILFKAKRMDNGEWVQGYIVRHPSAVQIGESSPWYIHVPPIDPDDSGGVFNVNPETVCQYTGLTDKNGVKIFEGDVLRYDGDRCFTVMFDGGSFYLYGFYEPVFDIPYDAFIEGMDLLEVVGNIHDKEADHED